MTKGTTGGLSLSGRDAIHENLTRSRAERSLDRQIGDILNTMNDVCANVRAQRAPGPSYGTSTAVITDVRDTVRSKLEDLSTGDLDVIERFMSDWRKIQNTAARRMLEFAPMRP